MGRASLLVSAVAVMLASCVGEPSVSPPASPSLSPIPAPTARPSPSVDPGPAPGATPTSYEPDVAAQDVPASALVPAGARPTGEWFAFTEDGVMIVVAWAERGEDVTAVPRGVSIWRRSATSPHWRRILARTVRATDRVIEIGATTADVTGDGSDDVLLFEGGSGTGGCGAWLVLEPVLVERIFRRDLCDGRVDPAPAQTPGLVVTEAVYGPGDAHCCPSAIRRTTLAWTGSDWRVTDRAEAAA
jgi:hypothetical protein